MHAPRSRRLVAALATASVALVASAALLLPTTASAIGYTHRDGACAGTEGVTVVVDFAPTAAVTPTETVAVRCVFGTPANGIDALERAGFPVGTADFGFGPFVTTIDGAPDPYDPMGEGYWSYWHDGEGDWASYMEGAGTSAPKPGSVEGWRYVGSYMTDPTLPPRAPQFALVLGGADAATVTAGANVTVGFTTGAGVSSPVCRVDLGAWVACSTATSHVVAGVTVGSHTVDVRVVDAWDNATQLTRTFTAQAPAPAPASVESVTVASVAPTSATVTAAIHAGGVAQSAAVEYLVAGEDPSTAIRTAARSFTAGTDGSGTWTLTGLAPATTYSLRVVSTGASSAWSQLTTPRRASRIAIAASADYALRGSRFVVELERLDAYEHFVVRLGDRVVADRSANWAGEARVVVTVPADFAVGSTSIGVSTDQADRAGSTDIVVTAPRVLVTTATRSLLRVGGVQRITARGLVAGEPVTLFATGGRIVRGTADARGVFTTAFVVDAAGSQRATVRGSDAARTGSVAFRVLERLRPRTAAR